jgi:light-regulated signal transduction histidine kinase (bacteriophytochrome)
VYRTIQLHSGDIDVESTPGAGTTFVIKMPRAAPGTEEAAPASLRIESRRLRKSS